MEGFIYFEGEPPIIRSEWINIIAEPPLSNSSGVSGNDWVKMPCMYAPMTRCQWSLSRNGIPTLAIHPSKTRRRVRYSPNSRSSFSFRTRKGSPGKSGQTFLWMTPGFRIRGSSQLKHFSKYCLKVILLRSW